jgi:ATP-dependent Lon protease
MSPASFVARTPLPLLPLRKGLVLPTGVTQLPIGRPKSRALFDAVRVGDRVIIAFQRDGRVEDPTTEDLHETVVVAKIREKIERKGRAPVMVVEGLERGILTERVQDEPYATHRVIEVLEPRANDVEAHALTHSLRKLVAETLPKESGAAALLDAAGSPSRVADALVGFLDLDDATKLRALESLDVVDRLRFASEALATARAQYDAPCRRSSARARTTIPTTS